MVRSPAVIRRALAVALWPAAALAGGTPRAVVSAVGDLTLAHWPVYGIYARLERRAAWDPDAPYRYPFERVKPALRGIVFGNMEAPLTDRGIVHFPDKNEPFYFQVPARFVRTFVLAGFDVLSLANNHIKDCGAAGVLDSVFTLTANGIAAAGAGADDRSAREPVILTDNGVRVGFLAYDLVPPVSVRAGPRTPGAAYADTGQMRDDIRAARARADAVVVSLHWGPEYGDETRMPPPAATRVALGRQLVDAGADAVLGHHSHAVERIERYRRGVIAYGLGNFVFAGTSLNAHKLSVIVRLVLGGPGLPVLRAVPVRIEPRTMKYRPEILAPGPERDAFLLRLGLPPDGLLP